MPFVITSACIGVKDKSCVEVCPVDCIYEATQMLVIDPARCIDCGACESECPVSAIVREEDVDPDRAPFVAINAAISEGTQTVDDLVVRHLEGATP